MRYFLEQGYETEGGHPGYAWFYSREKINERLGFETYHFLDGYYENLLTDENSLDGHPNDKTFFAERAESWEARDPSKPCFRSVSAIRATAPMRTTPSSGARPTSRTKASPMRPTTP